MKKSFIKFALFAAAAFAFTSCVEDAIAPVQGEVEEGASFGLYADLAADTKTYNDGMRLMWSEGDQLKVSYAFEAAGKTISGDFKTPFTTNTNDGLFVGNIGIIDGLTSLGDLTGKMTFSAVYPYSEEGGYVIPKSTVQTGYDSMAHLAGANCPLYGDVEIEMNIRDFLQGKISSPNVLLNHATSVAQMIITNNSGAPVVINSVKVGESEGDIDAVVREIKGTTIVEGATELADGETANIYVVVEPFTVSPSDKNAKLMFWVNDTPKEVAIERDITFTAGKIKKVNFSYLGDFPEAYAVADIRKEMTVERIVPSISTLVDVEYVKQWVLALKDHENIAGLLSQVAVDIAAGDIDAVFYAFNGLPGFEHQTEVVVGTGRHIRRVTYKATDYLASYIDKLNEVESLEDILAILEEVESYYEVTGFKDSVSNGMGTVLDYMSDLRKNVEEYFLTILDQLGIAKKPVEPVRGDYDSGFKYAAAYADYLKDLALYETMFSTYTKAVEKVEETLKGLSNVSLVDLVEMAADNEWAERILTWLFDNDDIRQGLVNYIIEAISNLEFDIEADNKLLEEAAKNQALMFANIAANNDVEANYEQLNQEVIEKLNKGPWGLYNMILNWEETYGFFEEYGLMDVYNTLQTISKTVENIAKYDQVKVEIVSQSCEIYAPTEIPQI